jgi:hemolysin D
MSLLDKLVPPQADPAEFSPPLIRLQDSPPSPLGRRVIQVLAGLLAALLLWSVLGRLDIVAVAEGKLVPHSYLKIVQPAEAGNRQGNPGARGRARARRAGADAHGYACSATPTAARSWSRLSGARPDAGAHRCRTGRRPMSRRPTTRRARARDCRAVPRQPRRAGRGAGRGNEPADPLPARSRVAEQVRARLVETLPHYQQQDQAFEKLVREGFAGSLMASDKKRERIEKEQELKNQIHLIESNRAYVRQSEKRLVQIDSDYRRQLHGERNEVHGQAEKLAQEVAKQAHRQSLLELRATQDSVVKDICRRTPAAPSCSRERCC